MTDRYLTEIADGIREDLGVLALKAPASSRFRRAQVALGARFVVEVDKALDASVRRHLAGEENAEARRRIAEDLDDTRAKQVLWVILGDVVAAVVKASGIDKGAGQTAEGG